MPTAPRFARRGAVRGDVVALALLCGPLLAVSAGASTLEELRWERRLVFAFGADGTERVALAEAVEARACELAERDVDVYRIEADGAVALSSEARPLDEASVAAIRDVASGLEPGIELVLVGKDGGVKRRAGSVAALDDFLVAIDAMPMRRAERDGDRCGGSEGSD